ncbi:MAG: hypothetical protein ACKPKO_43985 [Candidatus Fonsibacter sp.]
MLCVGLSYLLQEILLFTSEISTRILYQLVVALGLSFRLNHYKFILLD